LWTQTLGDEMRAVLQSKRRLKASAEPVLARIIPELAAPYPGQPQAPSEASEAERFHLADEIASLLLRNAAESGRVVVLDDLHAADASSLEVLAHLASRLDPSRLLIIGAHRGAPDDVTPALQSMLGQVSRHETTLRIALPAFDVAAVQSQLAAIVGRDVDTTLATRVHARTGGNPFFTAEVGRLIVSDGTGAVSVATAVPTRVRDVITWRLQRLPEATRDVLDRAALIGQDVAVDVLAAACERDPAAVLAALEPAVRVGLLRQDSTSSRVSFMHALVAETLVEALPLARAAELHEAVASAIEVTRVSKLEDWLPALARHWAAAAPRAHSSRRTVEVARQAAEQAEGRLAFGDALPLWRVAIDAAERAGSIPDIRAQLHLGLARSLFRTGELASALEACLAAAADAESAGRPDLRAAAALVLEGVTEPRWAAMLIGLAEGALNGLPNNELAWRARLHAQIGQMLHLAVPDAEGRDQVETARAVRLAEDSGDQQALQAALRAHQVAISEPEHAEERLSNAAAMIDIARDTGDSWPELWGRLWSFDALVQLGRLNEAEAELHELEPVVARLRWPVARWHLLRSRAAVLQARGRFDEALAAADRALTELSSGSGLERATWLHAAFLQGHAEVVGDVPGVEVGRRQLVESAAWDRGALLWATVSFVQAGRKEEARALYASMPPLDQWYLPGYVLLTALKMRLQIALGLELHAEVEQLRARMLPVARWHVTPGSGTFITFGSGFLYTGIAAAFLGDLDGAVVELNAAVHDNTRCGAVTMSVVARQELAEVLVRRKTGTDLDQARRLSTGVLEEARRLGMSPYVGRASALLRGMPRRRLRTEDLTPREFEVARLVAEGLTNRAIAVRLGVSERTIENHLDHIFSKLGFASRAQVAAWVTAAAGESAMRH
jgi:DNA-binding CsgD family transcriptional regulator